MNDTVENKLPLAESQTAPAAGAPTPPPAPKTAQPVDGRDEVIDLPNGTQITVGDVLARAFAAAETNVKGWNALPGEKRGERLTHALAAFIRENLPADADAPNDEGIAAMAAGLMPAASPEPDPAPSDIPPATGVAVALLLKDGPLGGEGEVVRVSHAKLASLGLESGKHWRPATAAERETAGK